MDYKMIEKAAEAIWEANSMRATGRPRSIKWRNADPYSKDACVDYAKAALEVATAEVAISSKDSIRQEVLEEVISICRNISAQARVYEEYGAPTKASDELSNLATHYTSMLRVGAGDIPCKVHGIKATIDVWTPSDGTHVDFARGAWIVTVTAGNTSLSRSSLDSEIEARRLAVEEWNCLYSQYAYN